MVALLLKGSASRHYTTAGRSPFAALLRGGCLDEPVNRLKHTAHSVRDPPLVILLRNVPGHNFADDVPGDAPLSSDHIRASWRNSSSSQPLVAASWNIAWNSVESMVGTLSWTHFWLNRCGTSKIAIRRL
jgi:hypothetical protein